MQVHIITIGDELLIGQIIDTNSAKMAQMLLEIGAKVTARTAVGDDHEAILQALRLATSQADIVLVTGGLGPTKDDVTKKAIADFYEVGFVFHQPTLDRLNQILERLGRSMNEALRTQCFIPQNATILTNKMGSAPGLWFEEGGKVVVSMPGVPFEMEYLMQHEVLPRLQAKFNATPTAHRTLFTAGEGESTLAEYLKDFEENLPPQVKLAYLPSIARVRLRLTVSDPDPFFIEKTLNEKFREMEGLLPPKVIAGQGDDSLEGVIGRILKEKNLTLSTAESCTGGYLAHLITSVPGSSVYFMGSVVSYANAVKMNQLGVKEETLREHGAVSEQTVREMVAGANRLLGTDVAVATSGIAGPDGGTPEKPVGTVWLAVGNKERTVTRKLQLGKNRLINIQYSGFYALNLLRLFLLEK
ncbi:MAG: competence/damage-inducible protein A [Saprospiraceae bacterium]|nr:competence/damage-inducible protein A [Saprospiraceae bacterium]MCF8251248.1 competence/damage-inducible protein A [Saprospiraceae bacterium]MCF8282985.1 competence/damage-inducible protein A [Bacteroidales bacterium]MCF8313128.1 competence/damage-inducible protein A [Saprospiraceae bacterium]MCF8441610.1 competence/damage-inducible protein A [Saprospiraceae bacterium]